MEASPVGIGLGTSYVSWIGCVERRRPRRSYELSAVGLVERHSLVHWLSCCAVGLVTPASWLLHCDEGWTVCLVKQVDSSEGLPVSLVEHVLVDGRKASIIVLAHLVDVNRSVGWSDEGCFRFAPLCGNAPLRGNFVLKKKEDWSLPICLF